MHGASHLANPLAEAPDRAEFLSTVRLTLSDVEAPSNLVLMRFL